VWTQASEGEQRTLLRAMASRDQQWSFVELEATTGLDAKMLRRQLRWAERHDIVRRNRSDQWEFQVPLLRRWIKQRA
jgi:DNA-binding HxlR family transcriptional regulator